MNITQARKYLDRENSRYGVTMTQIPREEWAHIAPDEKRIALWRSRHFLAQVFAEPDGVMRISINRTRIDDKGRWDEGISWDDLQRIKREVGYGESFAVEIVPPDKDIVNVANMRHLWVLPRPLDIGWRNT